MYGIEASNRMRINGQRVGEDGERGGWIVDRKTVRRVGSAVGFVLYSGSRDNPLPG